MPGIVMEQHGSRNGAHTNHDRDQRTNGVNGSNRPLNKSPEKGKGRVEPQQSMTPVSPAMPNGLNDKPTTDSRTGSGQGPKSQDARTRMDQLPPELVHLTEGYIPLKMLLSRMAQKTHGDLIDTISALESMPTPSAAVNGNTLHPAGADDNSQENINKKMRLLNFATTAHEAWTKAMVINGWSRNAEEVSRLIDLFRHLKMQIAQYTFSIDQFGEMRKQFENLRRPNPDLKVALEVMTTGKAGWMPDLNYIPPRPLTDKEILHWMEKLNTLISIRLNLHDYDSIPFHFKDYSIRSGRVTFKVPGEFELDLSIASESEDAQFWFCDLRFLFAPSAHALTFRTRHFVEDKINLALHNGGLAGCYQAVHEMILTYKINEFTRQGAALVRGLWTETLKVESLHRAISIQYWMNRYTLSKAKSWVILGVHSGRRKTGRPDPKATSRLFLRWFRDSKEQDVEIPFDAANISTEALVKTVVLKHTEYILTSIYDKLREKYLYANGELALSLVSSSSEPAEKMLKVQLTKEQHLSIKIDPICGRFVFSPQLRVIQNAENRLNGQSQNPANDAHHHIEALRVTMIAEDILAHGITVGWSQLGHPGVKRDVLAKHMPKDAMQVIWMRREKSWEKDWYLIACLATSGDRWLLLRTAQMPTILDPKNIGIATCLTVPMKDTCPPVTYSSMSALNAFASALITTHANIKALQDRKAHHILRNDDSTKAIQIPSIYARLSSILPSGNKSARTKQSWAKDVIKLSFQGLELVKPEPEIITMPSTQPLQSNNSQAAVPASQSSVAIVEPLQNHLVEHAVLTTEARLTAPILALKSINENIDRDIAFNAETGSFSFRLQSSIGNSVIPKLIESTVRVERLVDFVQVLEQHKKDLKCESVSLGKIVFKYGNETGREAYEATIDFSTAGSDMNLSLKKGNPHIRILDILSKILNGSQGLSGVATMLPLTLFVLRGLDSIEDAWDAPDLTSRGMPFVNVRSSDCYHIRYCIVQPEQPASQAPKYEITFEIHLRHRRGEAWWYIRRHRRRPHAINATSNNEQDMLDEALKSLWEASGDGWMGMRVGAVAQRKGAEVLLQKVDEVVRTFVASGRTIYAAGPAAPVTAPQPLAPVAPMQAQRQSQQAPVAPMRQNMQNMQHLQHLQQMHQQQRNLQQQATPNHSQSHSQQSHGNHSQSQGRGNAKVIEID